MINTRRSILAGALVIAALVLVAALSSTATAQAPLTEEEALGKAIFFDESLSIGGNQSCATCHAPESGWTGPDSATNAGGSVYEGSVLGRFGDRKPPSAAYATQSPVLSVDKFGTFSGGSFWDGRATGEILGNPAAEQAKGPFLNPVEQALPDAATLVNLVCTAPAYGETFKQIWGEAICDSGSVAQAYDAIGYTIAAYEASPEVNAFSSKYDASLGGGARLTQEERQRHGPLRGQGQMRRLSHAARPRLLVHRLHLRQPRPAQEP